MQRHAMLGLAFAALLAGGCSSVGGSAIRTGSVQMPAYSGPVAIYSSGQPPPGATDLGVVEVHAVQEEGTVDVLLPQFVRKVAQIGGNVAVIDGIRARFEIIGRTHVETYYYTCGLGATCAGTRVYSANDEMMVVSIFGRAYTTLGPQAPPPATPEAPLLPREQPPTGHTVELYVVDQPPPTRPYYEIALVQAVGYGSDATPEQVTKALTARAATIGCDAVVRTFIDLGYSRAHAAGVCVKFLEAGPPGPEPVLPTKRPGSPGVPPNESLPANERPAGPPARGADQFQ